MQQSTTNPVIGTPKLPIDRISVHPTHNPRKNFRKDPFERLVESIRAEGIIQPITVRPRDDEEGGYWLISGERRLRAAKQANLTEVPAYVRDVDEVTARRLALLENLDRDQLGVGEESIAAQEHLDAYNGDHEAAAKALGWSASKLKHRVQLLHASEAVMAALVNEDIHVGHAELLASLPHEKQDKALPKIIAEGISVADLKGQLQGYSIPLTEAIFDRATAGCGTHVFANMDLRE